MDNNNLLMVILAFAVGYCLQGMMKNMCGGRLFEGSSKPPVASDAGYNDGRAVIFKDNNTQMYYGKVLWTNGRIVHIGELESSIHVDSNASLSVDMSRVNTWVGTKPQVTNLIKTTNISTCSDYKKTLKTYPNPDIEKWCLDVWNDEE